MLDESRVVPFLLVLALGAAGCATEEEAPPIGAVGVGATGAGGDVGLAPNYETGGDDGSSNGGAAQTGTGGATSSGATSSGVGGTPSSSGSPSSGGSTTSSSGGTTSSGGAGGTGGGGFDLCALFPCAGGMAGTTGAGGTAGAAGGLGTAGAGGAASCDNLFCFDIFDCAIFHLDALSCNFTKCEGFVCKP